MRLRRTTVIAVGLTTIGTTAAPASSEAASSRQDRVERSIIRQLNAIRAQHGLGRLRASRGLAAAADAQSARIARTRVLSHGPDMGSRVRRFVRARSVGETLAFLPATARAHAVTVVRMWMRSPGHRATLLSPRFRRVGLGRRRGFVGGSHAIVYTADLATAR